MEIRTGDKAEEGEGRIYKGTRPGPRDSKPVPATHRHSMDCTAGSCDHLCFTTARDLRTIEPYESTQHAVSRRKLGLRRETMDL